MPLQKKIQFPEPQYLHDASGRKSFVVLTVDEYRRIMGLLKDSGISPAIGTEKRKKQKDRPISGKKKSADFYGILKSANPDFVKQITEDKEVFYDI
ncbi:MAG: hypothetical protein AB7S75_09445 [Desulfococcaceae bacterium]